MAKPPSLPQKRGLFAVKFLSVSYLAVVALVVTLLTLILADFLRLYTFPSDGMSPAIPPNDQVVMEGITYLFRGPRRGEIVVYRTDGMESAPPKQIFAQRLAGLPGDSLRIAEGKLYVNGTHLPLSNSAGEISYETPPFARYLSSPDQSITVPESHYFVLGDNSLHSRDSRFIGFLPAKNLKGRIIFRK